MKMKYADFFVVEQRIPADRIVSLFISACEGGSNYWCKSVTPRPKKGDPYETMLGGFYVVEHDPEDVKRFVSVADIERAVRLLPTECPAAWTALLNDDTDAETADCFLQLCVFQKVVYG